MKKLMTIGLAAAMMFAMAGKASATALETSGEFRARYWALGNYFESGKSAEFWDSRLRLTMVWPVAEGVKFTVRGDINEGFWGDSLETATTTAGVTTYGTTSNANSSPTRPSIAWDQVNLSFAWPNTPITIVVGRQTTTWGPGLFVAQDNRDRFRIHAKFDATTVFYTYDKYVENVYLHETDSLDDRSQHTIGAVSTVAGWNVGGILAWVPNGSVQGVDSNYYIVDGYAMGKAGPVDIKTEFVYGMGTDDFDSSAKQDIDVSGFGLYVGATMPAGPVTVGFEGAYVSGDDPKTTSKNEGKFKSDYQSPFWSIILFNNLDYNGYMGESKTATAALGTSADDGMANAFGVKASVSTTLMPGLTLYGAALYASRLEDQKNAAGVMTKADPLGTEIDVVGNYAITPNVSWTIGIGYLVAGDFFGNVDNPVGAMSAFTVKF